MGLYLIGNGITPTSSAAFIPVTSGTSLKTLLQLKPLTGIDLRLWAWGFSCDASAAATPGKVELVETDVAATVTASVTGDITRYQNPGGPAADTGLVSLGTAATGYTASVEGSITVTRYLDGPVLVPPTGPFTIQIPLGAHPLVQAAKFARIRCTFGAAVNVYCWMLFAPDGGQ